MGNGIGQAASTAKTATFTEMKTELEKTGDNDRSIRAGKSQVWTNSKTWNVATNIFFGIGKMIRACFNEKTQGATAIKDAINAEFGAKLAELPGHKSAATKFADKVLSHLKKEGSINSTTELRVGDLQKIQTEIDRRMEMLPKTNPSKEEIKSAIVLLNTSNQQYTADREAPKGNAVKTLLNALKQPTTDTNTRDHIAKALRGHFDGVKGNYNDIQRSMTEETLSSEGNVRKGEISVDVVKELFSARDSKGDLVLPTTLQRELALGAAKHEMNDKDYDMANGPFRGATIGSKCVSAIMGNLDNGAIKQIGKDLALDVQREFELFEKPDIDKNADPVGHREAYKDELNALTKQTMALVKETFQNVNAGKYGFFPETQEFMSEFGKIVDEANKADNKQRGFPENEVRRGMKSGKDAAFNIFVLRGLNGEMASSSDEYADKNHEGETKVDFKKLSSQVKKTIQTATNGQVSVAKNEEMGVGEMAKDFADSVEMTGLKNLVGYYD
ncbi:MAG: hypothetical protein AAFN17_00725 [Pseudomonadota bacterium]